jgi:F0F1-type ATP synthase membrane subunit b/b'
MLRFESFARDLIDQANAIPQKTLSEVGAQIEQTAVNIRAAAEATIAGQQEAFERISS